MAAHNFEPSLTAFWQFDGFKNDQAPGENFLTAYGVTQSSWDQAIEQGVIRDKSLGQASQEDCKAILHVNFWNALRCEEMPAGVDLMLFNDGSLSGVGHTARLLQRVVGFTGDDVDGVIGPATMRAVLARGSSALIDAIVRADDQYLASLAKAPLYLKGWMRRELFMQGLGYRWAKAAT